jgi:hypothetical protein
MLTRTCLGLACALTTWLMLSPALAEGRGDGVYERFDSDLTLQIDLGPGVMRAGGTSASFVAELRARIIDAAGVVLALDTSPSGPDHVFVGLELRPLWPGLFLLDHSSGYERWDLMLESLGVEIGAGLTPLGDGLGVGLSWGIGLEVPLILPETFAQGIWLRLGARHQDVHPSSAAAPNSGQDAWLAYVTLALRGGLDLGFARWQTPRYRLPARH